MKKFFVLFAIAVSCLCAGAQDYNVADYTLCMRKIIKVWHNQNLYTNFRMEKPTIKEYFISFAETYPEHMLFDMMNWVLGYPTEGSGKVDVDIANGYIAAEFYTEFSNRVEMCYWRCDDGGVLVGVNINGAEYFCDDDDPPATAIGIPDGEYDDYEPDYSIADLMFFKIAKGEVMWWPKTPKQMCGRDFNFGEYIVHLPRQGKDITISREVLKDEEFVEVPAFTLRFNGSSFDVIAK